MKITQAESVISVWNGHVPFDTCVPLRVFWLEMEDRWSRPNMEILSGWSGARVHETDNRRVNMLATPSNRFDLI